MGRRSRGGKNSRKARRSHPYARAHAGAARARRPPAVPETPGRVVLPALNRCTVVPWIGVADARARPATERPAGPKALSWWIMTGCCRMMQPTSTQLSGMR